VPGGGKDGPGEAKKFLGAAVPLLLALMFLQTLQEGGIILFGTSDNY